MEKMDENQKRRQSKVEDIDRRVREINQIELRKKLHLDDFMKQEKLKSEA
jgi:hypothetical protein